MNHSKDMLHVDLSKPPNEDIEDDRPVSVRDALVFLELACFESPASIELPGGKLNILLIFHLNSYSL